MTKPILLSHACFPPMQYFAHLTTGNAIIEKHANYNRQTYRNRYLLAGANGILTLSIPVIKSHSSFMPDKDVKIAYHTPWQKIHWRSIISAYNSSPFFEFYRDDLEHFFNKKFQYLLDYNLQALELITELLELEHPIIYTDHFLHNTDTDIIDLRESIHPKKSSDHDIAFRMQPYKQVFDDRHGFIPNLSILDLLFNKGPEAFIILEQSTTSEHPK